MSSDRDRPPLFQLGDFTLASGRKSRVKIECDALTPADWEALAVMAAEILPPFGEVYGVPRGGFPFAFALNKYATGDSRHPTLLAEDVVTTGGSITRERDRILNDPDPLVFKPPAGFVGVCAFARGEPPPWVFVASAPWWVPPLFRPGGRP